MSTSSITVSQTWLSAGGGMTTVLCATVTALWISGERPRSKSVMVRGEGDEGERGVAISTFTACQTWLSAGG